MGCSKNYAFKSFRFCQNFTAIHQYSSSTTLWGVTYSIIVGFGYGDKVGVVECYFIIPYATPHRMILLLYAPQTNPDSQRRTAPTLELLSRAVSSVGVTSPIQRSQHRKQFWRRVDHKKNVQHQIEKQKSNGKNWATQNYIDWVDRLSGYSVSWLLSEIIKHSLFKSI